MDKKDLVSLIGCLLRFLIKAAIAVVTVVCINKIGNSDIKLAAIAVSLMLLLCNMTVTDGFFHLKDK